jgi:DNA-binding GntR family transcriptional regulator
MTGKERQATLLRKKRSNSPRAVDGHQNSKWDSTIQDLNSSIGSESSLTEIAYNELKHRIITLKFRPGEYLNAATICASLKITRTPVNQALQRLRHEGLVQIIPRKGVIVQPVTLDEVMDVIDVRLLNEPFCVGLATERISESKISQLSDILAEASDLILTRDVEAMMKLDSSFHRCIASAAGNNVLSDLLSRLHDRSLRFWVMSLSAPERMQRVQSEHEDILQNIRDRNQAKAIKAMENHIKSFRQTISGLV